MAKGGHYQFWLKVDITNSGQRWTLPILAKVGHYQFFHKPRKQEDIKMLRKLTTDHTPSSRIKPGLTKSRNDMMEL